MDWQKWMKDNHVKLRGVENDGGEDAVSTGGGIFGTSMDDQSNHDAREPGNSHVQKHEKRRKTCKAQVH